MPEDSVADAMKKSSDPAVKVDRADELYDDDGNAVDHRPHGEVAEEGPFDQEHGDLDNAPTSPA